ncbi:hypothetical protein INT45_001546 [Circinella minor]|uniref:Heterokaryon incompatibility domain-containing protein n=1 Tax=Circinella minor TaxID=1195481 RepID=A0A8H7VIR9_9FUNG|nr:hypothetical protein INT45_001546 [Circinella minor]
MPNSETTTIRCVGYEEALQPICKDFQIEYVWYDKVCIDQTDSRAKSNEINQMHKIYRHARYILAMVPEVRIYNRKGFKHGIRDRGGVGCYHIIVDVLSSRWFKRSWMPKEHSLHSPNLPTAIGISPCTLSDFGSLKQNRGSVNQALDFAHFQTNTTRPPDMIFAFKNPFFSYV